MRGLEARKTNLAQKTGLVPKAAVGRANAKQTKKGAPNEAVS